MARKPVPTPLKLLRGTARNDRTNPREPQPKRGAPPIPRGLHRRAAATWKRLAPMLDRSGVLTEADATALELLCDALSDYHQASEVLRKEGSTYTTTTPAGDVMHRPRPEVAQRNDAWQRVAKMLSEFGLTPSSRSKVVADPGAGRTGKERFFDVG